MGVQARVAFGAFVNRPRHGLCWCRRCRAFQDNRWWQKLEGVVGTTGTSYRSEVAARCRWYGGHTIILDKTNPGRIYVAISAAGAFRSDDEGETWKPINQGLSSEYIPDPHAEVGHCVHRIAMHPAKPDVLFMQKHWDVMRTDNAGELWTEVSGNLPSDFGFVVRRACTRAKHRVRDSDQERFRTLSAGR